MTFEKLLLTNTGKKYPSEFYIGWKKPSFPAGSLSKFKTLLAKDVFVFKRCPRHACYKEDHFSCRLPKELLWYLYIYFIHDKETVKAFQSAFGWEHLNCQRQFCQQTILEQWKETRLDTVNIAEIEYTKIYHYERQHILFHPSVYHIQRVSDGFTMTNYKHVYFNEGHTDMQQRHRQRLGRSTLFDSYVAYNMIHIYDPNIARHHLHLTSPIPRELLQLYYPIKLFFKKEQPYIRSVVIDRCTPTSVFTQNYGRPCQEWTQTLFDMYTFQKKHSPVLRGLKNKVITMST